MLPLPLSPLVLLTREAGTSVTSVTVACPVLSLSRRRCFLCLGTEELASPSNKRTRSPYCNLAKVS